MSPPSPLDNPNCRRKAPSQPNCHQHTMPTPHTLRSAQLQPGPQQQQLKAGSPDSRPSPDPRLTPAPGQLQDAQRLCQPPAYLYLQGNPQSGSRYRSYAQTSHSCLTQPTQQHKYAQQVFENFQRSCLDNQAADLSELAIGAERSPALTPGPQNDCTPAARQGPRIKTTIRTGMPGHAHSTAVKVVASGRVLACAESPRANSASPTAIVPGRQARSPSAEASVSGTTVTLAASGSPTPSALDSTVGATSQQRPATAELNCSETLGTASPQDQLPIFLPSPGAHTDTNAPHHQSLGRRRVHSPQAATQVSASETLNKVAANEHHSGAVNTSPAVLTVASEPEHAITRAAAAAAGDSGGAETAEEWAPDEEAMQAASALAGLAESNWAGKAVKPVIGDNMYDKAYSTAIMPCLYMHYHICTVLFITLLMMLSTSVLPMLCIPGSHLTRQMLQMS